MKTLSYSKAIAFLLLIALVYTYIPFTQEYSTTPKWLLVTSLTLMASFFLSNTVSIKEIGTHVWVWLGLIFCMLIGSFFSYNFWDAISQVIPLAIALISVLVFNQVIANFMSVKNDYKIEFYLALVVFPLVLLTAIYLFYWVLNGEYGHDKTYQLRFAFGHRNQLAQFLVLLLPVFLNAIQLYKKRFHKIIFTGISILITIAVILLQARSAIVVLIIVYPLFFSFYLYKKLRWNRVISKRIIFSISLLAVIAVVTTYLLGYFDFLFASSYGSGNERIVIWKNTLKMIQESPLTGVGTGDWKIEILNYPLRHTKAESGYTFYQRAHNEFLQIFAEIGIVGFLLLIAFFGFAIKKILSIENLTERFLKLAFVLGFIVIMNLSFPLERIELIVLLFLVIGVRKERKVKPIKGNSIVQIYFLRLSCLILLLFSSNYYNKELTYASYLRNGDISILKNMDRDFYSIDPTSLPIAWYIGNHYYDLKDYQNAVTLYKEAMLHNPNHVHLVNNLGGCYYAMNDVENSIKYFEQAKKLSPSFADVKMNLSALYFNQNLVDSSLNNLLSIPLDKTPSSFQYFAIAIAQKKLVQLTDKLDEPVFENFLDSIYYDTATLLNIVNNARLSSACYEDELRLYQLGK
jgi:O-antigen ligase